MTVAVSTAPRALILVENQPVPLDRRVWPECLALREAGYDVTVICPQGQGLDSDPFEVREGVEIHRYPPAFASGSTFGYLREYWTALWQTTRLVYRLRGKRFDVVQACNPPDLLLIAALPLKRGGTKFIFDHHDVVPELYRCRFGARGGMLYRLARVLEAVTFRLADVVISTNDSYRKIAVERGGKKPEDVFVVRNAPDPELRPIAPDPELKRGKPFLLGYVGIMGPQDGVDLALRALAALAKTRRDWHAIFIGDGHVLPEMRRLAVELGIDDCVEFTGFVADQRRIGRMLATADVTLAPEPKNAYTDMSTMIKIAEYMAMKRPTVCFDLTESRITADGAALYAEPNDEATFARCIDVLLDDPELRARMGECGRSRVERGLSWEHSKRELQAAYARALNGRGPGHD
jgi:glycosyltransferase involved in cell wall biosynthesis